MKKFITLAIALMLMFAFSGTLQVYACWNAPEPFEIISDDGSKIFVFTPAADDVSSAHAAVYEIVNNERLLVYQVEDLASFAYESNFHFSTDMMHFARTFPGSGMHTFEVFSYGVRTRVVMRSDFIEDHTSAPSFTSIGPNYTVNWRIEGHSTQNTTITINTDEGKTVFFDLATAKFSSGNVLSIHENVLSIHENVLLIHENVLLIHENVLLIHYETPPEGSPAPIPQTQNSPFIIFVIAGAVVTFITLFGAKTFRR